MSTQIETFLRYLGEERKLSTNTLSAYRNDLRQFEEYITSDRAAKLRVGESRNGAALKESGREELVDFFLHLREKGYSAATIARKMAAVKSIFQYLHSRGQIPTDPAAALGSPEVKKPLPRAISMEDIAALLSQASKRSNPEGLRDAAMLQLLCSTGMRVTELVSVDMDDIDLGKRRLFCTGRNSRRRELPLDEQAIPALDRYFEQGRPSLLRSDVDSGAMFLNHRGQRLTRQGFWLIMKAMARESGIATEVTPHILRHSFATHRLRDGLGLRRLRELLGHANISTTQIYTQVRVDPQAPSKANRSDPVGASSS